MISKRTSRSYVTHAESAPAYWMIGVLWHVLATGVQTGNSMCLLDQLCSKGSGPPRHMHPQEEALYVASGTVTFNAGGTEFVADAGSLVTVPRHTEHSFIVDEEANLINFYFPAGFDLWLMGSAVPAQRNEVPPPEAPMPPYALTKQLSDHYGGLPLTAERTTSPNLDALAAPTLVSRRTAEALWFHRGCWSILADAASTGGSYSVFEVEMPRGLVDEPHIHDQTDRACYVLDGELDVFVDDEVHGLSRGSFIFIPRGSVHASRVRSGRVRYLMIHTTPGYERVLRAFGMAASEPALPPAHLRQESPALERLKEVYADIGLRPIVVPSDFRLGATR